jgi:hypothetical protein
MITFLNNFVPPVALNTTLPAVNNTVEAPEPLPEKEVVKPEDVLIAYKPPVLRKFQKERKDAKPPSAQIQSITESGRVTIRFSKPMFLPDFLRDIPDQKLSEAYVDPSELILAMTVLSSE